MAKRGRKPNPDKKKDYFGEEEEKAVVDYLNSESTDDKSRIYNTVLRPAFNKMVESIIRRYKLYIPDETFEETFNDAMSFILIKADKFNPDRDKKAYSYYGTMCRNYLKGRQQKYSKNLKRTDIYDEVTGSYVNSLKYSDYVENSHKIAATTVEMLINKLSDMTANPKDFNLKDDEIRLGFALKNLLENWDYVLSTDGSNKLNKNAILLFLKDSTGLDTKGIRDNMKKFKKEFLAIKNFLIS